MSQFNFSNHEEFILTIIAHLQPEAYGYSIKKELSANFNVNLSLATIHTILYRLDKKGYLHSSMGGSDQRRGGRSKRLYEISQDGKEILLAIKEARDKMYDKVNIKDIATQSSI